MSNRTWILMVKDWAELRHQHFLVGMTLFVAVAMVALGPFVGVVIPAMIGPSAYEDPQLKPVFDTLRANFPALARLSVEELFQVFILRQFLMLILVIPVVAGTTIAGYSIVGEKVNRSLEPLLATPISTSELLFAKGLAATIPSVLISWMAFVMYVTLIGMLTSATVLAHVANAAALCIMLLVTPAIAVLGLSMSIIASSRVTDPRTAQQLGAIVIVPVVGLIITQTRGMFFVTPIVVVATAAAIFMIDAIVLVIGVRLFRRETILTRWR